MLIFYLSGLTATMLILAWLYPVLVPQARAETGVSSVMVDVVLAISCVLWPFFWTYAVWRKLWPAL